MDDLFGVFIGGALTGGACCLIFWIAEWIVGKEAMDKFLKRCRGGKER